MMSIKNYVNNLSDEDLKRIYKKMLMIRKCEEHLGEATKNGAFPGQTGQFARDNLKETLSNKSTAM